jgi:N-acetylmuramoyl-L-alanine amidase
MTRPRWGAAWRALAMALALAGAPRVTLAAPVPADVGVESAALRPVGGVPCVPAAELSRLLSATRYWRADVRKLVLRAGEHRVVLTVDNPFVMVDDRTVRLDAPVRSVGGELMVPASIAAALPRDSALATLALDARGGRLLVVPADGLVRTPVVTEAQGATRVTIACDHPERVEVLSRTRRRFRVRVPGAYAGLAGEAMPAGALVTALAPVHAGEGTTFEFALDPAARAFRVAPAGGRLTLEFLRLPAPGATALAPDAAPGPRAVRTIVLDPAHGGSDTGVLAEGLVEKDLTLALARTLRAEIERRLGARVVLTREDDRAVSLEARAETANRAHADAVIVLHFDGFPSPEASGASAYCAPLGEAADRLDTGGTLAVIPWRDVALRHAADGRALAESVLGALDALGAGPVRLREWMPLHLVGVNATGISLECATLTSAADRARLAAPGGMAVLATGITDGLAAWQRNE